MPWRRLHHIRIGNMVMTRGKGGTMSVTWVGMAAAFCTTVAFLPQVIKTWKTRSTKDISLGMFSIFSTGIFLWLVYGLALRDIPLIAANGITLLLTLVILGFKLRHG
jgi:MtN3 and saliva related transmembrane protein